jgi:hypothetical protein
MTRETPLLTEAAPLPARSIWERRAEVGLTAPTPEQRRQIWGRLNLPDLGGPYEPWEPIAQAHDHPASIVLVSGAERVGKSVSTFAEVVAWIPFSRLIWLVGDTYMDSNREFEYLAEGLLSMGLINPQDISHRRRLSKPSVIRIDEFDCIVETRTLVDLPRAMSAEAPDLIAVCEAAHIREDPVPRLRMRLSTRRGRLWISGSMEDNVGWLADYFERWETWPNEDEAFAINVPLWVNRKDFPGGRHDPEIRRLEHTLPASFYLTKVEGRPGISEQVVFHFAFQRGQRPVCARPCPFVALDLDGSRKPVEIAVDPGYYPAHYVVLAIQRHGDEVWVIDEVAAQGEPHESIIRRCMEKPWWPNVIGGVIDPHAVTHGQGYQATPLDIWAQEAGIRLRADARPSPEELIERCRYYIAHPGSGTCRLFFDPDRCPLLLREMRTWKYTRNSNGRIDKSRPQEKGCDAIKALGYYLVDLYSREHWQRTFPLRRPRIVNWRIA